MPRVTQSHVVIVLAIVSILVGLYGNHLQSEQLHLQIAQFTKTNVATATSADSSSAASAPNVSIWPFVISSLSPIMLFILLVIVTRQHDGTLTNLTAYQDRVHRLEELWAIETRKTNDLAGATNNSFGILMKQVGALDQWQTDAAARLEELRVGVDQLAKIHVGADREHGYVDRNLASLMVKANRFWRTEINVAQKIPGYVHLQARYFDLIREAGDIIEAFEQLRDMYGRTVVPYKAPFSTWRPGEPAPIQDEAIREWEHWARSLVAHLNHCAELSMKVGTNLGNAELAATIKRWGFVNVDMSGDWLFQLLQKHGGDLSRLRADHAALWNKEVETEFTT